MPEPSENSRATLRALLFIGFLLTFSLVMIPSFASAAKVEVKIKGLQEKLKKNCLEFLSIYQEGKDRDLGVGRILYLHKRAKEEIKKALMPFGYFRPRIKASIKAIDREKKKWLCVYNIQKGPRIRITKIDFNIKGTGKRDPFLSSLKPEFKEGDFFEQAPYEEFKKRLLERALEAGYLKARLREHKVLVNLDKYQVTIRLVLDTGNKFRFGKIRVAGSRLSRDFIKRFAGFREKDTYSPQKVLEFKRRLLDSGYFASVDIRLEPKKGDIVDLKVILSMKRPNIYKIGAGYASYDGPRLKMEWQRRYLNERGHRLRTRLQLSRRESLLSLKYVIPALRPYSDYLSLEPEAKWYDTESKTGQRYRLDLLYSVATEGGWRRNAGLNLEYERYRVNEKTSTKGELLPYIWWYKSVSDNLLYTKDGYMMKFGLKAGIAGFLTSSSFLRSFFDGKLIKSPTDDTRLISRINLGYILTRDITEISASNRFFAGGLSSIRGFSIDQLGPVDPETGDVVGGRYLAILSLEFERTIYRKWSGAIFCDTGNSFDPDFKNKVAIGTGFGIRWLSPLGLVRFDFGFGVSEDPVPFRFYFSIGPDF